MPFDFLIKPVVNSETVLFLDMMEFALDGGKSWSRCAVETRAGRRCLLGAAQYVRRETNFGRERAVEYLARAIAAWQRRNSLTSSVCCDVDGVVEFNDAPGRKFSEILGIIREARELAMVDAYVAAIELFVGGSDWRDVCGGWPDNPVRSFLDNEPLGLLQAMSATAEPEPEPPMKC